MANGRGRPKKFKEENGLKYGLCRSIEAENNNGILMRTPTRVGNFKFTNADKSKFIWSVKESVVKSSRAFPMGVILKDCEYFDCLYVDSCLYTIKSNQAITAKAIATKIFNIFQDEMGEYNPAFLNNTSNVVCYHLYMAINMRYFGNNLSVINQIINDIHYCLFRTHPACYLFRAPVNNIDPLYYLDIYVSNFSVTSHSYLSTIMSMGIDSMTAQIKTIMSRTIDNFTNNGKRPYHVNPFSVNPISITPNPNAAINLNNERYADWYSNLFGDEVVRRYITDKPLIKI